MTKDPFYDKVTLLHHKEGTTSFVDKHEKNVQQFFAIDPAEVTDKIGIAHAHAHLKSVATDSWKFDLSALEKIVFMEPTWKPDYYGQSRSRIMRVIRKAPKPKIVRDGRYYVRCDMIGIELPQSFKFRTKREAIKYWSRSPIILRSAKQCAATSLYANLRGSETGRISNNEPTIPLGFSELEDRFKGGIKKGELLLVGTNRRPGRSPFSMTFPKYKLNSDT